jgi:hypothetical protein
MWVRGRMLRFEYVYDERRADLTNLEYRLKSILNEGLSKCIRNADIWLYESIPVNLITRRTHTKCQIN